MLQYLATMTILGSEKPIVYIYYKKDKYYPRNMTSCLWCMHLWLEFNFCCYLLIYKWWRHLFDVYLLIPLKTANWHNTISKNQFLFEDTLGKLEEKILRVTNEITSMKDEVLYMKNVITKRLRDQNVLLRLRCNKLGYKIVSLKLSFE